MPNDIDRLNTALEGRYRIERELGQGGMATVYLADDLKHNRRVAVKVLKADLVQVLGKDRFLAEIKTTANLQHPNILPLFDSGEADGLLFYVMPYVDEDSLRSRMDRDGQFPIADAIRLGTEVAEALDHAHKHGVVHRDIKPANILLRDGRPLVADFGISLALGSAGETRLTETGMSLGTPWYMSPEQALGDQPVTAAADQYALACVIYEMLVGEPPHTGGSAQAVLARIITGNATPASEQRPSTPANVDAALRKALERIPGDRFTSTAEFAAALRDPSFRYGENAEGKAVQGIRPLVAAGLAVVAVVVGFALGGLMSGGGDSSDTDWNPAARPDQLTFSGLSSTPAVSPDGEWVAYLQADSCPYTTESPDECGLALRVQAVSGGQPVTVVEDIVEARAIRWSPDGEAVVFNGALRGPPFRLGIFTVARMGGAVRAVAEGGAFDIDPDGTSLWTAPADDGGTRWLTRIAWPSGEVLDSIQTGLTAVSLRDIRVSPDGSRILIYDRYTAYLLTREGEVLDRRSITSRGQFAWSPDGRSVLTFVVGTVQEDDLVRLEVATAGFGAETIVRGGISTNYSGHMDVASETGDIVWVRGTAGLAMHLVELRSTPVVTRRFAAGTTYYGVPVPADSVTIYYIRGDAVGDNLYRFNVATGEEEALTEESTPSWANVRLSSDGLRLTYVRNTSAGDRTGAVDLVTGRHRLLEIPMGTVYPFGADAWIGKVVGAERDHLGIVRDANDPPELIEYSLEDGSEFRMGEFAFSPDGAEVLFMLFQSSTEAGERLPIRLVRGPIDGGSAELLWSLSLEGTESDRVVPEPRWTRRGIHLVRALRGESGPSIWTLDEASGRMERTIDIPLECDPDRVKIDPDFVTATCWTEDPRTDLVVLPGPNR